MKYAPDPDATCPMCHGSMLAVKWNRPAIYCSRLCRNRGVHAAVAARQAEVDDVAVIRLVSGSRVASTKAERVAAVAELTARGRSASWIAAALHVAERSVCRYRAALTKGQAA